MRRLLSIGLSLSMLAVCCFGALPASAAKVEQKQPHHLYTFADEHRTVFPRMRMGLGLIEGARLRGVGGIVGNGRLILKIIDQQHVLVLFRSSRQHGAPGRKSQQQRRRSRSRQ